MTGRLVIRRARLVDVARLLDVARRPDVGGVPDAGADRHDGLVDVVAEAGRIVRIAPAAAPTARAVGADDVLDADGGVLLPGLHDHHLHLLAMAAARRSVAVGPPAVVDRHGLTRALLAGDAAAPPGAWLRAVGYHESVAGELDGDALDALVPQLRRPVRIQHRSGACWTVNAAGAAALALADAVAAGVVGVERRSDGRPTGRLFGLDDWLRARVASEPPDLAAVGAELAAYGITGVTDATPTDRTDDVEALARAALPLRVVVTGAAGLPADAAPALERGPVKLYPADHRLPSIDELAEAIRAAWRLGRAVAVHCVTRAALVVSLAAWDDAGGARPGDRLEHGAVVPLELAAELAARGITVVTQPGFVRVRGDAYLDEVDAADRDDLWRCAALRAAGVRVAGSSDAPFGPADPWLAMAAAVDRATASGRRLGVGEALGPGPALALYLGAAHDPGGPPRRVRPGAPADLCLLDGPLDEALTDLDARRVAATVAAGRVTHRR